MPSKYDPETRAKAVRLVLDHRDEYPSEWAAIIGWEASTSKEARFVESAIRQAAALRSRQGHPIDGAIHHSDAGSQYTAVHFGETLALSGLKPSIGSVGDAYDNALCESTIGLFKTEAIDNGGPTWTDRSAVEWRVARWVHWYNTRRLHSSIGYLPPVEFEQQHRQATETTPGPEVVNQPALR